MSTQIDYGRVIGYSAYEQAVAGGYTGTKEQYEALLASYATTALKAEGYAVGKQNGVDVTSGSDYYHNNAKYYKEEAASSATAAETAAASATAAYGTTLLAPTYSTSGTYAVGDYCIYDGNMYRCTTAITSGESWTSGHWTQVAVGSEVGSLKSAINTLDELIWREKETETTLTPSDSGTGFIKSTGAIDTSQYYLYAYDIDDSYAALDANGDHVAPQFRYGAFYNTDNLSECGTDTLVGEVQSYTQTSHIVADVPRGAKLFVIAVQTSTDRHTCVITEEYYPVTDLIDENTQNKLDKDQGSENAGKALVVNEDGEVEPGSTMVVIDATLTQTGKAADAKVAGDKISQVISYEAKELLYTILKAGVYTSNQATNLTNLAAELHVVVISRDDDELTLANVVDITAITQDGKTLICA